MIYAINHALLLLKLMLRIYMSKAPECMRVIAPIDSALMALRGSAHREMVLSGSDDTDPVLFLVWQAAGEAEAAEQLLERSSHLCCSSAS